MEVFAFFVPNLQSWKIRVARWSYVHGLFCAGHPYSIITFSIVSLILCCLPLVKNPLPGYAPLEFVTPITEFAVPVDQDYLNEKSMADGLEAQEFPEWLSAGQKPASFIQQIVVSAQVSPWSADLIPVDAVRTPLRQAFDLLKFIHNFSVAGVNGKMKTLGDDCFSAESLLWKYRRFEFLPENECLVISPANIWDLDVAKYQADSDILGTIFAHEKRTTIDAAPGFKDLAFGIPWSETGIKPQIFNARKRTISFAVTVVLRTYDPRFISALTSGITKYSPLEVKVDVPSKHIVHIQFLAYPELVQFLWLIITYVVLLLYLCFSVSKLEMVKSKVGLAISAVVSIFSSFAMSLGLCSFFGFTSTVNGGEIFPYLVIIIGLENVIVITKSVVSTPVHLDVKYRIAQGVSREGWGILKYFVAGLFVLILAYFTTSSVPGIQEFCLFGFVGLVVNMYHQMFFFCAVLSIDISRMDLADHPNQKVEPLPQTGGGDRVMLSEFPVIHCPVLPWITRSPPTELTKSPAVPASRKSLSPASRPNSSFPRRVRILWFLGSRRFMQRALIVFSVVWIGFVVYKSGYFLDALRNRRMWQTVNFTSRVKLPPGTMDHTHKLSFRHWPTLFGYYNVSLSEKYISVLPPIVVSVKIPPSEAVARRHPLDHKKTPWKEEAFIEKQQEYLQGKLAEQDLWVLIILAVSTTCILAGCVLYALRLLWPAQERLRAALTRRCNSKVASVPFTYDVQVHCLLEHVLGIENLVVDEDFVASSCIGGQLRIWNWNEGEQIRSIKRSVPPFVEKYLEKHGNETIAKDPGSHKEYFVLPSRQIWCLALHRGRVAAGCADGIVELYEAQSGVGLGCYKGSSDPVSSLALTAGHVLVGRESGTVDLLLHGHDELKLDHGSNLHLAAVGRITIVGEQVVTVGYDNVIKVLRLADWVVLHSLWNPVASLSSFCLDEASLFACSGYSDGQVKLWNLAEGNLVRDFPAAAVDTVKIVCLNDAAVFGLYTENTVAVWNRRTGLAITTLDMGPGYVGGMVVREKHLFIAGLAEVRVMDAFTLEEMKLIALEGSVADYVACPRKLTLLLNSDIICDYGRQIRVLRFGADKKSS